MTKYLITSPECEDQLVTVTPGCAESGDYRLQICEDLQVTFTYKGKQELSVPLCSAADFVRMFKCLDADQQYCEDTKMYQLKEIQCT